MSGLFQHDAFGLPDLVSLKGEPDQRGNSRRKPAERMHLRTVNRCATVVTPCSSLVRCPLRVNLGRGLPVLCPWGFMTVGGLGPNHYARIAAADLSLDEEA